jgi:DNA-binding CsgD family transcriptional regulator/PAS domain-containing protein
LVGAADAGLAGRFDELIGDIYECVLEPGGWPAVLGRICATAGGAAAWIAVHYPGQVRSIYEIEVGTDPEQQRRLRTHYVAASPFIGAVHHVRVSDVISVEDVVDYDEFLAGRFYQEWAGPQGWPDLIMGVLTRDGERFTWLGLCLRERARPEHKARVAAILPHLERAIRISDLLEQRTAQAADLTALADSLTTGLILVDGDLRVRGINPAAERLLRSAGAMSVAAGRLHPPRNEAGARLAEAVRRCADRTADAGGASVVLDGPAGEVGLLVHVLPLSRPRANRDQAAVAALFLTNQSAPAPPPIEAFVDHFGLTPSETRVLLGLLDGRSPGAIAAVQGVSIATVRTHLRRLYDKTSTAGQADLVRLVASAGAPL